MANVTRLFSFIAIETSTDVLDRVQRWSRRCYAGLLAFATIFVFADLPTARAAQPEPWGLGFQPAASPTMQKLTAMNDWLFWLIVAIAAFVLVLLLYVMVRFRESRNPTPSKTTHNTTIEVVWTVVPVIILALMVIPSFKLLYFADRIEAASGTGPTSIRTTVTSPSTPTWSRMTSWSRTSRGCWRPTTLWCCRSTPGSASW